MTDPVPSMFIDPDAQTMADLRREESLHESNLRAIQSTDQAAFRRECDRHMDRLVAIFRSQIDRRTSASARREPGSPRG